jgi:outer membrane cobalamin receptor
LIQSPVPKFILSFIFLIGSFIGTNHSQSLNDTLKLKEVEIKPSFQLNNQGFKKVRMDSTLLLNRINTNLSTILSQNSTIFIKSYGSGGLATASFRGTSANHTQVEWNGININSPMLGQMDLSQVPVAQFDAVEILFGAAGIPRTSGAFGGVIDLVTNPDWNNKLSVLVAPTLASFKTFDFNANFAAGTRKFQSITVANYCNSVNDFPYYDNNYNVKKQTNSSYNTYGLTQEFFIRAGKKDYFSGKVWYNYDFRNIPPKATNTYTLHYENQKETAVRSVVEWKRFEKNFSMVARSAFIDQNMNYKNDTINADHHCNSWINRLRMNYTGFTKFQIKPGMDFNYDWVKSDAYDEAKSRNTIALFSEFLYEVNKKIQLNLVLREDVIDYKFKPFIPALGVQYNPFNKVELSISASLSKNYRFPTLNDLYWSVSGNPNLKPENDYASEMSVVYHFTNKGKNFFIETELTGYYSYMQNLIMWYPEAGSSLWRPENISKVLSRGIETGLKFNWLFGRFKTGLSNNYHFCKATYESTTSSSDASLGKQLIYTPVNTFNSQFDISYRGFYFSYNFIFVGKRYTSKDNLTYMPAYNLSDIIFGKNFAIKKYIVSLQVQINNLFDLALRSIANVPLPGRNYAFTLRFNFNK